MSRISVAFLVVGLAASTVHAQTLRKVLEFPKEYAASISVDDAGTAVYAVSSTNQLGTNPGYLKQIVRWDPATGAGTQITNFEEGVESVSVSDDGTWLAFVSRADPLGTNHDESAEVFVMHPDGTGLAQLTSESFAPYDLLATSRGVVAAVISGSGNRVAFVGRVDPLGTNPTYEPALFVIDRGGTNLRLLRPSVQVPTNTWFVRTAFARWADQPSFDISDDGSKVVYMTSAGIGGINANGTSNHTFTSTSGAQSVALSGNGNKIVYTLGVAPSPSVHVRSFDGNPGTIVGLGQGEQGWITDDATLVTLYRPALAGNPAGVWRVASTGGPYALIAPDLKTLGVSGDGSRIVARGAELYALDGTGANLRQLTTTSVSLDAFDFALSSDGSAVSFQSSIDPLGTNPAHDIEWFSYNLDTGQFWQRTGAGAPLPSEESAVSPDDGSIFFLSSSDPAGQNSCAKPQLFRLSPGGGTTQLTSCSDPSPYWRDYLAVRLDGAVAAFIAEVDFDIRTFAVRGDGTGRTDVGSGLISYPGSMSVAGTGPVTWVAFTTSNTTLEDGGLFRAKADGTTLQRITTSDNDYAPSISADGSVVAWYAGTSNLVWREATQTIEQIPSNDPDPFTPMVTQDGRWVFGNLQRFDVESGAYEFVRGGPPDATGARWIPSERTVVTGSKTTLWLADVNAVPAFTVGKASPTVLSWDASPFSLQYDVIRGSIANLSIAGSTVSLGPVSCLEDDSPDNHTNGYGDPVQPAPGQAFFYLYRGSVGFDAAAGSYGQGSGGKERVAGTGGCNP
jgi:Tol biopolymer transport system component